MIRTAIRDAGTPYTPAKLYYSVWSGERFREMQAKFEELGIKSPFDEKWMARMTRTEPYTTSIDVTRVQPRSAARRSRRTPPRSTRTPRSGSASRPRCCRGIHPFDEFRLAQSRVGPTDVTEDDLFAGVRSA